MIIEEERRLHKLKCWEVTTLKMFKKQTSLLSSPGKMIEEPYEITGIAQPETIRHKTDLLSFIELSL